MKLEAIVNDIKNEFIELCCGLQCRECELRIAPSCCIWYTFRYLENHGMVRKGYIGLENDICNKYFKDAYHESYTFKHHVQVSNTARNFVTWLNENGYLKGVE